MDFYVRQRAPRPGTGLRRICGAGICLFLERSEERTDHGGPHLDNGLTFALNCNVNPPAAGLTPGTAR